jgi:hypothetical protein
MVLIAVHALIHFMGVAKAFGLAELAQLTRPIGRGMGLLWLAAGLTLLAAAVMVKTHPPYWWWVGFLGLALSQAVILSAWSDARFGTVANVLIALFALHAFAAEGPVGLRSEYREAVQARLPEELVGEITISAVLHFDESGELVDFVSDDRLAASPDGKTFLPLRWSEPASDYRDFGERRVFSRGEGRWHPPGVEYAHLELELLELEVNRVR